MLTSSSPMTEKVWDNLYLTSLFIIHKIFQTVSSNCWDFTSDISPFPATHEHINEYYLAFYQPVKKKKENALHQCACNIHSWCQKTALIVSCFYACKFDIWLSVMMKYFFFYMPVLLTTVLCAETSSHQNTPHVYVFQFMTLNLFWVPLHGLWLCMI